MIFSENSQYSLKQGMGTQEDLWEVLYENAVFLLVTFLSVKCGSSRKYRKKKKVKENVIFPIWNDLSILFKLIAFSHSYEKPKDLGLGNNI